MIAVTNTFLQGAGQDHIDGTFQGWAHFAFCIRSLVSWSLVSTTLVLAGSGALHSTQVYHPLEELCDRHQAKVGCVQEHCLYAAGVHLP